MLSEIPNTMYVVLRDDTRHARKALERGSIITEDELAALPEVQAMKPGDIAVDIGAYVGDTCHIFHDKGAEVWAFEPYPDAFEALRINCPWAHKLCVAVGDGRCMFASGAFGEDDGNHGSRMVAAGGRTPSLRIDDLNLPKVTLCKIDVEGAEVMVLDGIKQTITRCKPIILIECYNKLLAMQGFTRADVLDRLKAMGYSWRVAIGNEEDDRLDYIAEPIGDNGVPAAEISNRMLYAALGD